MQYYSEILDQVFQTEKECLEQEKKFKEEKKIKDKQEQEEKAAISRDKKYLADKIEEANKNLKLANENYKLAQEDAKNIIEEANQEASEILKTAKELVRTAEKEKVDAVMNFNKKYGVYTTVLTDDKVLEEFNRTMELLKQDFPFKFFNLLF